MTGETEEKPHQQNGVQAGASQGLSNHFGRMSIRDLGKPKTYVHVFCQRFVQFVTINDISDFLDLSFLSLVDVPIESC